jgi:hypothetical protein
MAWSLPYCLACALLSLAFCFLLLSAYVTISARFEHRSSKTHRISRNSNGGERGAKAV